MTKTLSPASGSQNLFDMVMAEASGHMVSAERLNGVLADLTTAIVEFAASQYSVSPSFLNPLRDDLSSHVRNESNDIGSLSTRCVDLMTAMTWHRLQRLQNLTAEESIHLRSITENLPSLVSAIYSELERLSGTRGHQWGGHALGYELERSHGHSHDVYTIQSRVNADDAHTGDKKDIIIIRMPYDPRIQDHISNKIYFEKDALPMPPVVRERLQEEAQSDRRHSSMIILYGDSSAGTDGTLMRWLVAVGPKCWICESRPNINIEKAEACMSVISEIIFSKLPVFDDDDDFLEKLRGSRTQNVESGRVS